MAGIDVAEPPVTDAFLQVQPVSWAVPPARPPLVRRRWAVRIAKYSLPVAAIALLCSIAMWPELSRSLQSGRVTWRRLAAIDPNAGQMVRPRYRGVDERQRPYTISADTADRAGPERLNLVAPVGDVTLQNGTWLLLRAKTGVFIQHANELDLAKAVTLYRQDGTIMRSATATMNFKLGAATSNDYTHAEGPFGTLDAEGFTMVDKGSVIQFRGPAKLVLNGAH